MQATTTVWKPLTVPWYGDITRCKEASFSDVLAAVRQDLWNSWNYGTSPANPDLFLFPKAMARSLFETAAYST